MIYPLNYSIIKEHLALASLFNQIVHEENQIEDKKNRFSNTLFSSRGFFPFIFPAFIINSKALHHKPHEW